MNTKRIVLLLFVAAPLMAQTAPPEPDFAPFGIIINWTARINAVMGAEPRLVPPGPCDGVIQLRFVDERGEVLAEKTARVSSTASASLEFVPLPEGDRTVRMQIRPRISWVEVPPGPCRGSLVASVEVFNNDTGETLFVLPGEKTPPDQDFGPFGMIIDWRARINAVAPCDGVIHLRFVDERGEILAEDTARASANTAASLEWAPAPDSYRTARRLVRPQVTVEVPPGPCRGGLISNVEVYNSATGRTLFVMPGS